MGYFVESGNMPHGSFQGTNYCTPGKLGVKGPMINPCDVGFTREVGDIPHEKTHQYD